MSETTQSEIRLNSVFQIEVLRWTQKNIDCRKRVKNEKSFSQGSRKFY